MTEVQYMVATATNSNIVIAVGIADPNAAGKPYPLQGEPKIGTWQPEIFNECPSCGENQHIELIDGEIVVVDNDGENADEN